MLFPPYIYRRTEAPYAPRRVPTLYAVALAPVGDPVHPGVKHAQWTGHKAGIGAPRTDRISDRIAKGGSPGQSGGRLFPRAVGCRLGAPRAAGAPWAPRAVEAVARFSARGLDASRKSGRCWSRVRGVPENRQVVKSVNRWPCGGRAGGRVLLSARVAGGSVPAVVRR